MWRLRLFFLGLLLHCHQLKAGQGCAAAVLLTAGADAVAAATAAPLLGRAAGGEAAGGGSTGQAAAAAALAVGTQLQSQPRRRLAAVVGGGPDGGNSATPPCTPTLRAVARQQPALRQLLALAHAGYDAFVVDGGKPFTLLAPTDAALQQLAAGIVDGDERLLLQDGFYSVVLYHQLPEGALDVSELLAVQKDDGVLTSLGRTLKKERHSVTFDNSTNPVVATGGWPANNAPIVSSHKACNGWLHIIDAVLVPTQKLSNLPRLVDDLPDLPSASFWALLDGSALLLDSNDSTAEPPGEEPTDPGASSPPAPSHSNGTGIIVSGGNGTEVGPGGMAPAPPPSSSSGGSGDSNVLVVAASVAGGAVALCAAVVTGVLLRKRQLRRRRAAHSRLESREEEEEEDGEGRRGYESKASTRPVQVHVDA